MNAQNKESDRLKNVYDLGIECFGSIDSFNRWLEKPAYGLGDRIGKILMETPDGLKLVEEELYRIAYGALA